MLNQLLSNCDFAKVTMITKGLKFHIFALLRRTPLTRLSSAGLPVIHTETDGDVFGLRIQLFLHSVADSESLIDFPMHRGVHSMLSLAQDAPWAK